MANRENYISEGESIYLELAAKASGGDIYAGDMVVINPFRGLGKNTATISSLTGVTSSQWFIGVAEHDLSGGKTGLVVKTKGVFEFKINADSAGTGFAGDPVLGVDAQEVGAMYLHAANVTGLVSIGNIVGYVGAPGAISANTGESVLVRINPPAFRNILYGGWVTAAAPMSGAYPSQLPGVTATTWSGT